MNRPKWATVVGILAIIFGALGVFWGLGLSFMPTLFELQMDIAQTVQEHGSAGNTMGGASGEEARSDKQMEKEIMKQVMESFKVPPWYLESVVYEALVTIAISVLYFLSGIYLLIMKPNAVKMIRMALGLSMIWSLLVSIVYAQSGSLYLTSQVPGHMISILIDVIFYITVAVSDKSAFVSRSEEAKALQT